MAINPEEFGSSFKGFMEQMAAHRKPKEDPFFVRALRDHFGAEAKTMAVVADEFAEHEHPNVQMALEDYVGREGRSATTYGIAGQLSFHEQSLTELATAHDRGGREALE